ncbi:MAG: CoA-binding protein [Thermoleophilia bacterium]
MEKRDEKLRLILSKAESIAVVGASPNPARPSNIVAGYLLEKGYEVIPVRPKVSEILDRRCYSSLKDIIVPVDIVDVFRRVEACPDIARDAVAMGAKVLWLQEGIISEEAAAIACDGGLVVVMDEYTRKVHERLLA